MASALVNAMLTDDARTENGMVTNSTSGSNNLDLFFRGGAMRTANAQDIETVFYKALKENHELALRILFWIRDIRGGAGERKFFRTALNKFLTEYSELTREQIFLLCDKVSEVGRWDDLELIANFKQYQSHLFFFLSSVLNNDTSKNGLLAKWLPRQGPFANSFRKFLGKTPKEYRKMLVALSNTVEQKMSAREWTMIEYSKIPSLAMSRYAKAFKKRDEERFDAYKESLKKGEAKINAGAIYPYDVIKSLIHSKEEQIAISQWEALPNFMTSDKKILPVCDVSGSMSSASLSPSLTAMDVCLSLGLYISERNKGIFENSFITFSSEPKIQNLIGNLPNRLKQLRSAEWGMSTDLEKVFTVILNKANQHNIAKEEMPDYILILSDMEFNSASRVDENAIRMIKRKYEESGYSMPQIVFWNLSSRSSNIPVKQNESGVALVSGFSPLILKSVLSANLNPIEIMHATVGIDRYNSYIFS
jgi:hypothetical protein